MDKIIQFSMATFTFAKDGRIFKITDEFNEFEDPQMPISRVSNLTGITNEQVINQSIDDTRTTFFKERGTNHSP